MTTERVITIKVISKSGSSHTIDLKTAGKCLSVSSKLAQFPTALTMTVTLSNMEHFAVEKTLEWCEHYKNEAGDGKDTDEWVRNFMLSMPSSDMLFQVCRVAVCLQVGALVGCGASHFVKIKGIMAMGDVRALMASVEGDGGEIRMEIELTE